MCLHGSLEINIPVLLRGHSTLEFVISAGTVQQEPSALLFPSMFLTIFTQAVALFTVSWAAPWQYCLFSSKTWPHQIKSQAHNWIVMVFGACAAPLCDKAALCKAWVPPHRAFKPQSSMKTKPYTLWGELILGQLCKGILFFFSGLLVLIQLPWNFLALT